MWPTDHIRSHLPILHTLYPDPLNQPTSRALLSLYNNNNNIACCHCPRAFFGVYPKRLPQDIHAQTSLFKIAAALVSSTATSMGDPHGGYQNIPFLWWHLNLRFLPKLHNFTCYTKGTWWAHNGLPFGAHSALFWDTSEPSDSPPLIMTSAACPRPLFSGFS